jgi:hypothetical protein
MALSLIMGVLLAAHRQFDSAPERICINSISIHLALLLQELENIILNERLYLQIPNQIILTLTGDGACKQDRNIIS